MTNHQQLKNKKFHSHYMKFFAHVHIHICETISTFCYLIVLWRSALKITNHFPSVEAFPFSAFATVLSVFEQFENISYFSSPFEHLKGTKFRHLHLHSSLLVHFFKSRTSNTKWIGRTLYNTQTHKHTNRYIYTLVCECVCVHVYDFRYSMCSGKLNDFLKSSSLNSPCISLRLKTRYVKCFSVH